MTSGRLHCSLFSLEFWDFILDTSMMFDTISSKRVEQFRIMPNCFFLCESDSVRANASLSPQMPWMGDRNSWETMAIKRVFRSSNVLYEVISVISWPTPITPTISLVLSTRGVAFSKSTATFSVRLSSELSCLSRNSKFDVSVPWRAFSNTSATFSLASGSKRKEPTRLWPIASARGTPEMSVIFAFHSVTLPALSTPKIGALAVSMSLSSSHAVRSALSLFSRKSVMSCPTPTIPMIRPSDPRNGVALIKM
mmetsp:Transcript_17448/g.47301  ORF Transcript_17448/g.47301 Transcript_17448/m.47301 type:complete len:252 (-) Transcript_17448:2692-3447(-)